MFWKEFGLHRCIQLPNPSKSTLKIAAFHCKLKKNWFPTLHTCFSLSNSQPYKSSSFTLSLRVRPWSHLWFIFYQQILLALTSKYYWTYFKFCITSMLVQATIKSSIDHFRPPNWSTCSHSCSWFLPQLHYLDSSCVTPILNHVQHKSHHGSPIFQWLLITITMK